MGEMNEGDLERVVGGSGEIWPFNASDWSRRNCRQCVKFCPAPKQAAALDEAREQAKNGVDWSCPEKQTYK